MRQGFLAVENKNDITNGYTERYNIKRIKETQMWTLFKDYLLTEGKEVKWTKEKILYKKKNLEAIN